MKKIIFTRDSLIGHLNITQKTLSEFERLGLIKPDGLTDEEIPFYLENTIEKATHIKKLLDFGYRLEDAQKIIKKIGLPKGETRDRGKTKLREFLTVGELAERVGVSPRTIKHWEDIGIIEPDMRSEGGFRLYPEIYSYLCKLIRDLQLFDYSLEEIKAISDLFRDFVTIESNISAYSKEENAKKLTVMLEKIQVLFEKMKLFREGINRWEDLLRKKKKEIVGLKNRNQKRLDQKREERREDEED